VRSSRAIERACRVDVAFRVITANQAPDHTTIARFRQRHEQTLPSVFTESLRLCAQAGMVKVGLVAVDGTKMGCPAALAANRTKGHTDDQVAKMLAEAAEVDRPRTPCSAPVRPARNRPRSCAGRGARRERFAAAKAHTLDPESRIMKTKDGYVQGYNAQAVATEDQIVVAAEVTDEHNDHAQLHPMIAATNQSLADAGIDEDVEQLLADAGYCSEDNLTALTERDPDCLIATRNTLATPSRAVACAGRCPRRATLVDKMDRKVSKKAGRAVHQKRQHIIEPVFGQTKDARGPDDSCAAARRPRKASGNY
jgi:hypothetical protein